VPTRRAVSRTCWPCPSSSRCLPASTGLRKDKPVTLPAGRARLATNPLATGSDAAVKTMGLLLGGQAVGCVRRHEDIELERGQFGRDSGRVAPASRQCTGSRPPGCDPRHNRGRAAPRGTPLAGGGYRTAMSPKPGGMRRLRTRQSPAVTVVEHVRIRTSLIPSARAWRPPSIQGHRLAHAVHRRLLSHVALQRCPAG
jgi:hypothetical protein